MPGRLPGGIRRARRRRDGHPRVPPKLVQPLKFRYVGCACCTGVDEVVDRVHDHGVVEGGRVVVVARFLVGLRRHDQHAVAVCVVGRRLGEAGVVQGAQRLLHDAGAVVNGVDHGLGPVVDVGDERVAHPHLEQHAVGALGDLLLDLGRRVAALASAVAVGHVVGRVVVALVEVPTRDVVDVAVVVVVLAVGERADQVAGIDVVVAVVTEVVHPRVVGIVGHVEHAVVVHVVGLQRPAPLGDARRARARHGQLAPVEEELVHQLGGLEAPFDAAVHQRDDRVGPAGRLLPRDWCPCPSRRTAPGGWWRSAGCSPGRRVGPRSR